MKHLVTALVLIAAPAAVIANDPPEDKIAFVSDATMFEGMFYSVIDFCAPHAPDVAATIAKEAWLAKNKELLAQRDLAMQELVNDFAADSETADGMKQWKQDIFDGARAGDRLYQDIRESPDMLIACSKRLGVLVSDSMSFQRLAPGSFAYFSQSNAQ